MTVRMSRTWWGERFLEALEGFTDPGRLSRGRSYLRNQRITSFKLEDGKLTARVRGSINPYYGVYEEPLYAISVQLNAIPPKKWDELIKTLGSRAGMITRLLLNEMPESINTMFGKARMTLLPASSTDFTTDCSCPDYDNPCKHIAGVCYLLASKLDQDPLLLFELRGLSRDRLRTALIKTPLGKVLAKSLADEEDTTPTPSTSFHTRPQRQKAAKIRYGDFWGSYGTLPPEPPPPAPVLPAILVRKGGDFPPFWDLERSFVETMMELYERVRRASKVGSY